MARNAQREAWQADQGNKAPSKHVISVADIAGQTETHARPAFFSSLLGLIGGIVSGALLGEGKGASPGENLLNVTCRYEGAINNTPLLSQGRGHIDAGTVKAHEVTVVYSKLPVGFHPFAVGASFITIGIAGARRHGKALNLWDLSRGNYSFKRNLRWPDFAGHVTVNANVVTKGIDFQLLAKYAGSYSGPTDLTSVLSWDAVLTQATDTTIREAGKAVIKRSSGKTFLVEWDAEYAGLYRKMSVRQQDATMIAETLTFANNEMRMKWVSDVYESRKLSQPR